MRLLLLILFFQFTSSNAGINPTFQGVFASQLSDDTWGFLVMWYLSWNRDVNPKCDPNGSVEYLGSGQVILNHNGKKIYSDKPFFFGVNLQSINERLECIMPTGDSANLFFQPIDQYKLEFNDFTDTDGLMRRLGRFFYNTTDSPVSFDQKGTIKKANIFPLDNFTSNEFEGLQREILFQKILERVYDSEDNLHLKNLEIKKGRLDKFQIDISDLLPSSLNLEAVDSSILNIPFEFKRHKKHSKHPYKYISCPSKKFSPDEPNELWQKIIEKQQASQKVEVVH